MQSQVCWGIEVGAGALKAVKLERSGDGVVCTDFAVIPHKRVLSTPEVDENESKRLALGTLVTQVPDLRKATVSVSVPGHASFARFAKLPPVEPKKIPDIVKFEAVQQIPFPIDDVEWDYQTFVAPDSPDVEVGIFAITRERVMQKLDRFADVGLTPRCLTLSSLAAYNALAYDLNFDSSMPGTVILDVGTTSTDLIVCEPGRMWIRTFPIGGHQFTEALATAFNLSYTKAEKLKKEAETTQHTRHVLQAMRPVFGDLAQDVQRSIQYYQSLHRDAKLTRLIGVGSTFQLPGLRKFLSQQLQIEVDRLENFRRVKMDGERDKDFQANALYLATATGLALQGLGLETIGANLMPLPVMRKAMWDGKTRWFVTAAALGLAAGGAAFIRPVMERSAVASLAKPPEIAEARSQAQGLKSKWTEVEGQHKPDPNAAASMVLLQKRDILPRIVHDLGEMLAAGQAKGPKDGAPMVVFRSFENDYKTGSDSAGPGGAAAPPPEGADAGPKPRVHSTLVFTTTRPEAEAETFVEKVLTKWLADNADRAGVPYVINRKSVKWTLENKEQIAAAAPAQGGGESGGVAQAPPTGPRPGGMSGGVGAGRQAAMPRPGSGPRPGAMNEGSRSPSAPRPGGMNEGSRSTTPAGAPGNDEVSKLAPMPTAEPGPAPGSTVLTFRIDWESVLRAPQGEGQKPEGAP
jgi:type IV pilus assembly protein PilM